MVGAACSVLHLGVFLRLSAHAGVGAVHGELVSTVVATTIAYGAHRYWSFRHRARTGVARKYLLVTLMDGSSLGLGVAVTALARYPLGHAGPLFLQIANPDWIALGTALRSLSYRRWVFPSS